MKIKSLKWTSESWCGARMKGARHVDSTVNDDSCVQIFNREIHAN
jgi:hypothetical protein